MQTNDEAVAMIKERRATRDCAVCTQTHMNKCKLCYITADKYFYTTETVQEVEESYVHRKV